jgi:hypothetical protein
MVISKLLRGLIAGLWFAVAAALPVAYYFNFAVLLSAAV